VRGYEQFREMLRDRAQRLTSAFALPIPIETITRDLGVNIRRHSVNRKKARLMGSATKAEISLPAGTRPAQQFSKWDRFLIAHELGHVILQRECNAAPLGPREYWIHERLCDAFARWLLLPEHFHRKAIDCPARADQKLNFSRYIERIGCVPWPVAAFRISEWDSGVAFLRLTREADKYKVTVSTFPDKKEVNRRFPLQHPLSRVASELKVGQSPTTIDSAVFASLPSVGKLSGVSMTKISDEELRVAVVTNLMLMPSSSVA
jgi:hypothetical protein